MKKQVFTGTGTALVTPFNEDGSIDFKTFDDLLGFQIKGGVESLIICGSTGESATLANKEKMSLIIQAVEYSAGKVPIIAGTGSNDTQASIDMTILAKEHGANAVLLVAPYYNKPGQEGFYRHFKAIADSVDIPCIIYNVPGRAASNINAETQLRLAEDCPNIVATKEASGDFEQIMQIIRNAPDGFSVYSGDDAITVPLISVGANGVISVISNYAPKMFSDCVRAALAGDFAKAAKLHYELFDLMKLNFIESNPAPAKAILKMMGLAGSTLRLPLLEINRDSSKKIKDALKVAGLIKK